MLLFDDSTPVSDIRQSLFSANEQGALYDLYDRSTLFQDAAGTTPWTTLGQPLGLQLDKSKGLVLGPELRQTGAIGVGGVATAATYDTSTGVGSCTRVDLSNQSFVRITGLSSTSHYKYTIANTGAVAILIRQTDYAGTTVSAVSAGTTVQLYFYGSASFVITSNVGTATFRLDTFKLIPGNHRYQATSSSRPTIEARVNRLTYSQDFSAAAWAKVECSVTSSTVPSFDGSASAFEVTGSANTGVIRRILQSITIGTSPSTQIFRVKKGTQRYVQFYLINDGAPYANYDLEAGTVATGGGASAAISAVGNGYYDLTFTVTSTVPTAIFGYLGFIDSMAATRAATHSTGATTLYMARADVRLSMDSAYPYQRVTTATDYADIGAPRRIKYDGIDDFLQTASVNFSATNKMTVWAGVRKLSDAAAACCMELSANVGSNNGSFSLFTPITAANNLQFVSRGTAAASVTITGYSAPISLVISAAGDISGDIARLRVNGVQAALSASDQGTGNYGTYPIYFGARAGTSFRFSGEVFSPEVIRGAASTAAQIGMVERIINRNIGGVY